MIWYPTKDARIKKRGQAYWARFKKRGVFVQESLHTQSFETARRLVENIENDILLGVNWKKERECFESAWQEFLEDKAKGIKTKLARPGTLREYINFGELYYLPHFAELRLSELERGWSDMVEKIRAEKPTMHLDNLRKCLMGFSTWAFRKGKIRVKPDLFDPDRARREAREKDGPGQVFSKEQLQVMRDNSRRQSSNFYLFMLMLQFMGMRPSEITQLRKDRIDLENNVIRLRRADTKTAISREVPVHPEVLPVLLAHLKKHDSPCLFPNHCDKQRPMDPTGFKKFWLDIPGRGAGRVYDIRHTFISNAIRQGLNPAAVARITGTSLEMIEKRYLHLLPKDLNSELEKFSL